MHLLKQVVVDVDLAKDGEQLHRGERLVEDFDVFTHLVDLAHVHRLEGGLGLLLARRRAVALGVRRRVRLEDLSQLRRVMVENGAHLARAHGAVEGVLDQLQLVIDVACDVLLAQLGELDVEPLVAQVHLRGEAEQCADELHLRMHIIERCT